MTVVSSTKKKWRNKIKKIKIYLLYVSVNHSVTKTAAIASVSRRCLVEQWSTELDLWWWLQMQLINMQMLKGIN